jgi:hypothetical protein
VRATGCYPATVVRAPLLAPLLLLALALAACDAGHQGLRVDPARLVPDKEVPELLAALGDDDSEVVEAAAARIEEAGDRRFIATLIELLPASQMGIAGRKGYNRRVVALERLSGEAFGGDWLAWAEWYGGSELVPTPGFTDWKGRLFAGLDPVFERLLRSELPARTRVEGIHWGGVPLGGIPALDAPQLVPVDQARWLAPGEPVLGLEIAGEARAYPLRILDWHELVNDRVGGVPVAVTACTLGGSAIAFERRVEDRVLHFDTSGLLDRSNKLMIDRETQTLWNQLTGRPVLGALAAEDLALAVHPLVVSRFADWRARHPDTLVLSLDTGHERAYLPGEPYASYFASGQKLFPVFVLRGDLPSKERIFGLSANGAAKAFLLEGLVEAQVVNEQVGDLDVVLLAREGRIRVEGRSQTTGAKLRYDAGGAVRGYRRDGQRFRLGPEEATLLDRRGRTWRITEAALEGPDGLRAPRVGGTLAYWFVWQSFHPQTKIWTGGTQAALLRDEE